MKQQSIFRFLQLIVFFSLPIWANLLHGQDLSSRIEQYAIDRTVEKVYLHLDKSAYAPGETIWFKAYLLAEMLPATESKNLYVDWIDTKGKILQHTTAPIVDGLSNGQFEIPADYKGSTITIKAYTRWMLNFDSAFLYTKTLRILQENTANTLPIKPEVNLEFFPEGGNAIAGVDNKIAFKATNQWGDPVKIKGVIVNASGKVIDSLRTLHDGMGFVKMVPEPNGVYTAKWTDESNVAHTTSLPNPKNDGIAMQVALSPGRRNFEINFSPSMIGQTDSVTVVGTMYQHPVFTVKKAVSSEPAKGSIPIASLPYGVLTITVFDQNLHPLAERITYINNNASSILNANMDVEQWGLSHKARNELIISLPDTAIAASLSIAVTDLAIGADSSENILSNLMLTSDLKGKVHNPAFYFKDTSNKTQHLLDLVMMTNGWRRFNWEQIIADNYPPVTYPKDTSYLTLSGKLSGAISSAISPGASIVLLVKPKDGEGKVSMATIDKNGLFNEPNVVLFDTATVYYQIQDKTLKGSAVQFMPQKLRVPPAGVNWVEQLKPDTTGLSYHWRMAAEANAIIERNKFKELENVTVATKTKSPVQVLDDKYTSGLFKGDGIQFDLVNDPLASSSMDIFTFLQGRVAGLQISGMGANASLSWRGGAPQLYIDEMPADANFVSSVNINDVAYIKVFRPPFMGGGGNGGNGAIAIYTRRGGDIKQEPGKGLDNNKVEGYTIIKEFYSPKYYSQETPPDADKDLRTTIFWNPNVIIDPRTGKATVSFYNNDVTDAFRVVIEGMSMDGRLIHIEQLMQ